MKVLALDHGTVRTGVAVSDPTGTIARPLAVIERVESPAGARELDELVAREAPERIIVGDPRHLSGAEVRGWLFDNPRGGAGARSGSRGRCAT